MKKINKKGSLLLILTGILIITTSQIMAHYKLLNDLILGAILGIGIGLILIAVLFRKYEPTISKHD